MNKFLIIGVAFVLVIGIGISFSASNESVILQEEPTISTPGEIEVGSKVIRLSESISMSNP